MDRMWQKVFGLNTNTSQHRFPAPKLQDLTRMVDDTHRIHGYPEATLAEVLELLRRAAPTEVPDDALPDAQTLAQDLAEATRHVSDPKDPESDEALWREIMASEPPVRFYRRCLEAWASLPDPLDAEAQAAAVAEELKRQGHHYRAAGLEIPPPQNVVSRLRFSLDRRVFGPPTQESGVVPIRVGKRLKLDDLDWATLPEKDRRRVSEALNALIRWHAANDTRGRPKKIAVDDALKQLALLFVRHARLPIDENRLPSNESSLLIRFAEHALSSAVTRDKSALTAGALARRWARWKTAIGTNATSITDDA